MEGIAKGVLITIIVTICFMLFTNLVFFFPWYMTMVVETFNLSQIASSDNYVKEFYYEDSLDRLKKAPLFKENASEVSITVINADDFTAIGDNDETTYDSDTMLDINKPYRQRGEQLTVTVSASYPLRITLWGVEHSMDIPVSFILKPVGLKHYKDLQFDT